MRGKNEPVIRFEGHYFDRHLTGDARMEARVEGLADPKAGAVKNPRSQAGRWGLLNRAMKIDRKAALSSVSWGLGQVMGSHWNWLGYTTVDALVEEARRGADGQVALMCRYIEKSGLVRALQERDWAAFARGYNGPNYRKNRYDEKMAKAFARYSKQMGDEASPVLPNVTRERNDATLRFGDRGADVKAMQKVFTRKGYILVADGVFGLITQKVIRQFQRDHFLSQTGQFGGAERAVLEGRWPQIKRKTDGLVTGVSKLVSEKTKNACNRLGRKLSGARMALKKRLRKGLLSISRRMA